MLRLYLMTKEEEDGFSFKPLICHSKGSCIKEGRRDGPIWGGRKVIRGERDRRTKEGLELCLTGE